MENHTKYQLKSPDELTQLLPQVDDLFVISCKKCFREYTTEQEPETQAFTAMAAGMGKNITGTAQLDFLCNATHTDKSLAALIPEGTRHIAVISCGLGVQTVAQLSGRSTLALCDSVRATGHHGMALTDKACDACAQCYLNMTGGICPIVDCSKSLVNGQCGGAKNGKCEVSPDKDCAWQKIQERLAAQGRLSELAAQPVQVRDYGKVNHRRISEYVSAIRQSRLDGYYGGVHPVENKEPTEHLPLRPFPAPQEAVIPLSMHLGAPATAIVSVGEHVYVGQKIAEAAGFISAPVHSSVSGTVIAIEDRPHATRGSCPAIVIRADGLQSVDPSIHPNAPLEELTPEQIVQIVRDAGIVGMGGAGFPTCVKLQPAKPVDTVLLNGCECEPMLTADHRIMLEYADDVILGMKAMMKAVGAQRGIIVIEDNKPDAIELMRQKLADQPGLEVCAARTKYPQGGEKMLIKRALGRSVPSGGLPADVGAIVSNVSTVKAVADAIVTGMPLIRRAVTVTGAHIPHPGNFMVSIGTSTADLVAACGGISEGDITVKAGGPMMGFPLNTLDVPIMKGSNGIITVPTDRPEPQPCIRCGRCVDVCPMELKPLYFADSTLEPAALKQLRIMDCMECRCCEYICSSKIPLVSLIKTGKAAVKGMK